MPEWTKLRGQARFREKFLTEMIYGEKGNFIRKGFKASEIYYAMTGREPEILAYIKKKKGKDFVHIPIYRIDRMERFQQEFILEGLHKEWIERIDKLAIFLAKEKYSNDERYQNFIAYMIQKNKTKNN